MIYIPTSKYSMLSILMVLGLSSVSPYTNAFSPSSSCRRSGTRTSPTSFFSMNMIKKVFIDGEAGTTGLQVRDRLNGRNDLEIISPPSELRKDEETRKKFINEADAVILCTYIHILIVEV